MIDRPNLLDLAHDGDEVARNQLLEEQLSWLSGYVQVKLYPTTAREVEIDDIVNATVLRYLERPPRKKPKSEYHLRMQLALMAYRVMVNTHRTRKKLARLLQYEPTLPDQVALTADSVDRTWKFDAVLKGMANLSEEDYAILHGSLFEDLPIRKLAERHKLPVSTIAGRLKRAKSRLLRQLTPFLLIMASLLIAIAAVWILARSLQPSPAPQKSSPQHSETPPPLASPPQPSPAVKRDPGFPESAVPSVPVPSTQQTTADPGQILVVVVDATTNQPISTADVRMDTYDDGGTESHRPSVSVGGVYQFSSPSTSPGIVYIAASSYAMTVQDMVVPGTGLLIVRLNPEFVIEGRVIDKFGNPVPLAYVRVVDLEHKTRYGRQVSFNQGDSWTDGFYEASHARANPLGEFKFTSLNPGRFKIIATDPRDFSKAGESIAASKRPDAVGIVTVRTVE